MDNTLYSWPSLILLGIGLRMALHLHYGARGPDPRDPVYSMLSMVSWVLLVFGILPAILVGVFSFVGVILLILAATATVDAVIQRRETQRRSMCSLLALLVGRGEQIDASVLLSGTAGRGSVGRAMRRLLAAIRGGTPLSTAVERYPSALPREAIAYVSAGETMQCEAAALKELSRNEHGELTTIWRTCVDRMSYLVAVLVVMSGVVTFVMIKIVPEFSKIFYEFDLELPLMTQLAVNVSDYFVNFLAVPILLMGLAASVAAIVIGICYMLDYPAMAWLGDMIFRGRRTADVLRILAIAIEHRQPLNGVLARLRRVYPATSVRYALQRAYAAVDGGVDWRDALARFELVTPAEQGLLKTAERAGNLPWALRAIAARNERRAVYRLSAAVQVLYPLIILVLGAFVAFFVVALFIPLVKLIEGLSG
jgi:type II secretory pathway component PulF